MDEKFLKVCKENRIFLNLEISDMASILKISIEKYQDFEEGKTNLDEELLKKIVKILQITPQDFLDKSLNYDLSNVPSEDILKVRRIINTIEEEK